MGSCEGSFKDRMPQWTLERNVSALPAPDQPVLLWAREDGTTQKE